MYYNYTITNLFFRYANEGHLSVVKLSTGGASTNYGSSLLTYDKYFSFPVNQTSFYIGGIPTYYQVSLKPIQWRQIVFC